MAISVLVSVALMGSGWISINAEAASGIEDPFDIRASPHFTDVAYSLDEPTYQTAFDAIGSWKVSTGAPTVRVTNSTMMITAPATTKVELTLAEDDQSGINASTRSYLQTKIQVDNLTAQYTNITMENASSGDVAWISFQSTVRYGYSSASGETTGVLYALPVVDTWYRAAFELTSLALTFYLYAFNGDCLANHYTNSANLTVGQVSELHYSLTGKASGSATIDYLYVSGSPPTAAITTPTTTKSSLVNNAAQAHDVCEVDPSEMDILGSGASVSKQIMGTSTSTDDLLEQDELNSTELLEIFGSTNEMPQRMRGKYVAKGWTDFRASLESNLRAKIAETHGVGTSSVFIIDYYIDYIQFATNYDARIANQLKDKFWNALISGMENAGMDVQTSEVQEDGIFDSLLSVSQVSGSTLSFDLPSLTRRSSLFLPCLFAIQAGAECGAQLKESMARAWDFLNFGNDDRIDELLERLEGMYDDNEERVNQLWNYTMEGYQQLQGDYAAMSTWLTGTVSNVTQGYSDAIESITSLNAQYMDWSNEQWQNTNAMYYQLLNQSDAAQRYFAGELAKQNEIVMNITQDIYQSISATNGLWNDFLSFGKPQEDTPLTEANFFGSEWFTYIVVIVVCIVIIALVFLLLRRPKSSKGGRRKS